MPFPDLTDTQVIVFTEWMGRSPQLVEDQVTYPLVTSFISAPPVKSVRGFSMFGMSFVYVVFKDGTELLAAIDDETRLRLPVRDFMSTRLQTVDVHTPVRELLGFLDKGFVPIVMMGDEFIGLITRIDLLNHLRRKLR